MTVASPRATERPHESEEDRGGKLCPTVEVGDDVAGTPPTAVFALLVAVVSGFLAYQQSPAASHDPKAQRAPVVETEPAAEAADGAFTARRRMVSEKGDWSPEGSEIQQGEVNSATRVSAADRVYH